MTFSEPSPSLEGLLQHSRWLAHLARRLVADPAAADDLAQDAWVAALRNPVRGAHGSHTWRAWLSQVVRRLARGRDPRRERPIRALERDDAPATDDVVARIEEERLLARLVVELEEPYRAVVLQRYYRGLCAARIARLEGIPPATVRTRLRRALALLRQRLERESGPDRREWPLASLLLAPGAGVSGAVDKAVTLVTTMGAKTTIAWSAATGALCALAVTEGVLPRLEDRTGAAPPTEVVARSGDTLAEPAPDTAESTAAVGEGARARSTAREALDRTLPALTPEQLRDLLHSSARIDQVRAIELLVRDGSDAAHRILIEAFLAASIDPVLSALLEEALLADPLAFAPAVLDSFLAGEDAALLGRLGGLLTGFVRARPELAEAVVHPLVGALDDSDASPERAGAATEALIALGAAAADEVGDSLVDREIGSAGVGSAAWILAQLPGEHAELVRAKLDAGVRALDVLDEWGLGDEEREALLGKTGSVAWVASLRPEPEHDRLSEVLLAGLLRTRDAAQAGTLAWSLGNLSGLSDGARLDVAQQLLEATGTQADDSLRQQYVRLLQQLAVTRPPGPLLESLIRMAEDERSLQGEDGELVPLLDRLLTELRAHRADAAR